MTLQTYQIADVGLTTERYLGAMWQVVIDPRAFVGPLSSFFRILLGQLPLSIPLSFGKISNVEITVGINLASIFLSLELSDLFFLVADLFNLTFYFRFMVVDFVL